MYMYVCVYDWYMYLHLGVIQYKMELDLGDKPATSDTELNNLVRNVSWVQIKKYFIKNNIIFYF